MSHDRDRRKSREWGIDAGRQGMPALRVPRPGPKASPSASIIRRVARYILAVVGALIVAGAVLKHLHWHYTAPLDLTFWLWLAR